MKNRNLVVVMIVMVVNAISYGVIIPLLYPYAQEFGLSASDMSLLVVAFSLAQFISTPIIGRLSDKFGRKPLLLICLLGSSISLALFASATSAFMLFAARIIDGATGGNVSVAQAIIADSTKGRNRAKAFGMLGAAFGFGFTFGPAIGGLLSKYSITAPFWFASLIAFVGVVLGTFILKETNTNKQRSIKMKGLFNFDSLSRALFKPITGPVLLTSLLALIAVNAMVIGFQSKSVDTLNLNTTQIALMFTLYGVVSVIMQGFGIRIIIDKVKSQIGALKVSIALSIVAMLFVALPYGYLYFFIAMMVFGIVSSPQGAIITNMISSRTKSEDQGGILGINQGYSSIAQVVGPLAAGVVVGFGPTYVFLITAAFFGLSLVASTRITRQDKLLDL